jgi:Rrf2 family transcriptional regulator, iron-sulfur cluster assembly transcription factor
VPCDASAGRCVREATSLAGVAAPVMLVCRLKVMRLELGRRADYAIRAAVDLANHHGDGERRKARAISDEMDIPASFLPQILAELVRADIAVSVAGRDGGYALSREPKRVTLLEVVRAVEGDLVSASCVLRGGPCRWEDVCAVHVPWARAQYALLDSLEETTLADLVAIDVALQAGTYQVPADMQRPRRGAGPVKRPR